MSDWSCDTCGALVRGGQTHVCGSPYRGYAYKSPPPPPYDRLVVGPGSGERHAYRGEVEVHESTGTPLHHEQPANQRPQRSARQRAKE